MDVRGPVALVGAFERDNFGDLLFPIVTRRYLAGLPSVLATPVVASTDALLADSVRRYIDVVRDAPPPRAVWVVGGEVGGPHGQLRHQPAFDEVEQGLDRHGQAYLPRMSALRGTYDSVGIANSVGVRNMSLLTGTARLEAEAALRELAFLSVRDAGSARYLSRRGIPHRLAPDLIHTIADHYPQTGRRGGYVVVQVNEAYLSLVGPSAVAEALARSAHLAPLHVRLMAAGLAPGHDSLELYEQVAGEFSRRAAGRTIEILRDTAPLVKVATIAGADLVLSTSLHCAVISTAYGVPRVALSNEKLAHYLRTWGEPAPVDVDPADLDQAVGEALRHAGSPPEVERIRTLAESADASARQAAAALASGNSEGTAERRARTAADLDVLRRSVVVRTADQLVPAYLHARFRGQQLGRAGRTVRRRVVEWVNVRGWR